VPLGPRFLGTAFLPLVASVLAMACNVCVQARLQSPALPGLTHGAVVGSLVLVGSLSYLWTRRVWVAVGMVIVSIGVTVLALFLLLLWALESAFE
jgi:hypothetical protein